MKNNFLNNKLWALIVSISLSLKFLLSYGLNSELSPVVIVLITSIILTSIIYIRSKNPLLLYINFFLIVSLNIDEYILSGDLIPSVIVILIIPIILKPDFYPLMALYLFQFIYILLGSLVIHGTLPETATIVSILGILFISAYIYTLLIRTSIKGIKSVMQKRDLLKKLWSLSVKDDLTSFYTEKSLEEFIDIQLSLLKRKEIPFSLLLIKNDMSESGLIQLSTLLKITTRPTDILFKIKRQDFLIILSGTDGNGAKAMSTRLKEYIKEHKFLDIEAPTLNISTTEYEADDTIDSALLRLY